MTLDDATPLQIAPEVQNLLEERGITEDDLRKVIIFAENGRQYHLQVSSGHRLASYTPSKVTYWVEYLLKDTVCTVFKAYSHRMKIIQGYNLPTKKEQVDVGWSCSACEKPLELAVVKLTYLDETFAADLPSCPACQRVFISEEQAVVKMAMAERMLEDK